MRLRRELLGYSICAEMKALGDGWDVGVFGGCLTHVGAVSLAEPDGTVRTMERPGHRDSVVSERWALALAKHLQASVCVRCGIHYDCATKEQLAQITQVCEEMLLSIMKTEGADK